MSGTIFDELKYFRSLNQYKHATEFIPILFILSFLGLGPAGAGGLPLQMPSAFAAFPPSAAGSGALAAAAAHHHAAVAAAAAVDQRSGGGSGADGRGFLWDPSGRIHPAANFHGHPG